MKKYKRLTSDEREEISRMLAQNCSFKDIAKLLKRHISTTISREIQSGSCNKYTYRAVKAQNRARRNTSKRKTGKFRLNNEQQLQQYIYKKLRKKWSPNQIAKELKIEYPNNINMRIASKQFIHIFMYYLEEPLKKNFYLVCDKIANIVTSNGKEWKPSEN